MLVKRLARAAALAVAAAVPAFALLAPTAATAKAKAKRTKSTTVAITRPTPLAGLTMGFSSGAEVALASGSASTTAYWDPKARAVGAQMVRISANWSSIAPSTLTAGFDQSDPSSSGYSWATLDEEVREAAAGGFQILLQTNVAPTWAEGANMPTNLGISLAGSWEPSATYYGEFAHALAERYSGHYPDPLNPGKYLPKVSYWQAWNEPNLPLYLSPQYTETNGQYTEVAAGMYRSLLNQFYAGVKSVSGSNYVVEAGLAPYGDDPSAPMLCGSIDCVRTHPIVFEQSLLCLSPALKRVSASCPQTYLDAADAHPYPIYGPTWTPYYSTDLSVATISSLTQVVKAGVAAGTALPRASKGIWLTEISWDTDPPDPDGIPMMTQAHWLEQSMYMLWKQGATTVLWWQLVDSPPIPDYASTYQGGVYFLDGTVKPGATAYLFPLVSFRTSPHRVTVWSRSPYSGVMSIQRQLGSSWKTLTRIRVTKREVTEVSLKLTGSVNLRGVINGTTSLSWSQGP